MSKITVHQADCVAWLKAHEGALFDACVTDPPYHLTSIVKRFGGAGAAPAQEGTDGLYARATRGFMGKEWDGGDVAFRPETWRAVYDRLKPGAHLVAFSGTRTYHRLACAIEDAGFEIRDCLMWTYGSGFPKSHDVSKAIDKALGAEREITGYKKQGPKSMFDGGKPRATSLPASLWGGWGSALKPALEPICLARKPLSEKSIAANVLKHGTGALNIDACRVATEENTARVDAKPQYGAAGSGVYGGSFHGTESGFSGGHAQGRWPANLLHDGSDEVLGGFPDVSSGKIKAGAIRKSSNQIYGAVASAYDTVGDSGSAARFFYSAKAGPADRIGTDHPTVKPVDLMRWLVRLITPAGGHVLDPFAGSGTTGIAALAEGFDATLIDIEADHVADINRKLAFLRGEGKTLIEERKRRQIKAAADTPLGGLFEGLGL